MAFIIIAIICLMISPIIGILMNMVLLFLDRRRSIIYLLLLCVSIAIPALFMVPDISSDAYRILSEMKKYSLYTNVWEMLSIYAATGSDYGTYPLFTSIMFLISRTHVPTLLPFIAILFTYFFSLMPFVNEYRMKRYGSLKLAISVVSVGGWISYVMTMSGMRFFLAAAIVWSTIYFDFFETDYINKERKRNIFIGLGYLCAALIHPGIVPVVLIGFFSRQLSKIPIIYLVFGAIIFFGTLQFVLRTGNPFSSGYVSVLVNRFLVYSNNSNFTGLRTLAMRLKEYTAIWSAIVSIVIAIRRRLIQSQYGSSDYRNTVVILLSLLVLALAGSGNIIDRLMYIAIPVSVYCLMDMKLPTNIKSIISASVVLPVILTGINYNQNIRYLVFNREIGQIMKLDIMTNLRYLNKYGKG